AADPGARRRAPHVLHHRGDSAQTPRATLPRDRERDRFVHHRRSAIHRRAQRHREVLALTTTWILGLDASTPRCVLALGHVAADGRSELVAVDDELDLANQASARLATRIAGLLARAGIEARQIGVVGCGRGPGTFTGTRVALATAKGLA